MDDQLPKISFRRRDRNYSRLNKLQQGFNREDESRVPPLPDNTYGLTDIYTRQNEELPHAGNQYNSWRQAQSDRLPRKKVKKRKKRLSCDTMRSKSNEILGDLFAVIDSDCESPARRHKKCVVIKIDSSTSEQSDQSLPTQEVIESQLFKQRIGVFDLLSSIKVSDLKNDKEFKRMNDCYVSLSNCDTSNMLTSSTAEEKDVCETYGKEIPDPSSCNDSEGHISADSCSLKSNLDKRHFLDILPSNYEVPLNVSSPKHSDSGLNYSFRCSEYSDISSDTDDDLPKQCPITLSVPNNLERFQTSFYVYSDISEESGTDTPDILPISGSYDLNRGIHDKAQTHVKPDFQVEITDLTDSENGSINTKQDKTDRDCGKDETCIWQGITTFPKDKRHFSKEFSDSCDIIDLTDAENGSINAKKVQTERDSGKEETCIGQAITTFLKEKGHFLKELNDSCEIIDLTDAQNESINTIFVQTERDFGKCRITPLNDKGHFLKELSDSCDMIDLTDAEYGSINKKIVQTEVVSLIDETCIGKGKTTFQKEIRDYSKQLNDSCEVIDLTDPENGSINIKVDQTEGNSWKEKDIPTFLKEEGHFTKELSDSSDEDSICTVNYSNTFKSHYSDDNFETLTYDTYDDVKNIDKVEIDNVLHIKEAFSFLINEAVHLTNNRNIPWDEDTQLYKDGMTVKKPIMSFDRELYTWDDILTDRILSAELDVEQTGFKESDRSEMNIQVSEINELERLEMDGEVLVMKELKSSEIDGELSATNELDRSEIDGELSATNELDRSEIAEEVFGFNKVELIRSDMDKEVVVINELEPSEIDEKESVINESEKSQMDGKESVFKESEKSDKDVKVLVINELKRSEIGGKLSISNELDCNMNKFEYLKDQDDLPDLLCPDYIDSFATVTDSSSRTGSPEIPKLTAISPILFKSEKLLKTSAGLEKAKVLESPTMPVITPIISSVPDSPAITPPMAPVLRSTARKRKMRCRNPQNHVKQLNFDSQQSSVSINSPDLNSPKHVKISNELCHYTNQKSRKCKLPPINISLLEECQENDVIVFNPFFSFLSRFHTTFLIPPHITELIIDNLLLNEDASLHHFHSAKNILTKIVKTDSSAVEVRWSDIHNSITAQLNCDLSCINTKEILRNETYLDLIINVLKADLYVRDLSSQSEIRSSKAYRLLSRDLSPARKDIVQHIQQTLVCLANNTMQTRCYALMKLLSSLQELLGLCVEVSYSCMDCAVSLAKCLKNVYTNLPDFSTKCLLLQSCSTELILYQLCELLLETQFDNTQPLCQFSLKTIIECFYKAEPQIDVLTPTNTSSHDHWPTIPLPKRYLPDQIEELAMLIYLVTKSYLQVSKDKLFTPLHRRSQLQSEDIRLDMADVKVLQKWDEYMTTIRKHEPFLTASASKYLTLLGCLADVVQYQKDYPESPKKKWHQRYI